MIFRICVEEGQRIYWTKDAEFGGKEEDLRRDS